MRILQGRELLQNWYIKSKKKLYEKNFAYEVTYSGSTCILSVRNSMGIRCIHEWQCNHQIHNLPFSESFFFLS